MVGEAFSTGGGSGSSSSTDSTDTETSSSSTSNPTTGAPSDARDPFRPAPGSSTGSSSGSTSTDNTSSPGDTIRSADGTQGVDVEPTNSERTASTQSSGGSRRRQASDPLANQDRSQTSLPQSVRSSRPQTPSRAVRQRSTISEAELQNINAALSSQSSQFRDDVQGIETERSPTGQQARELEQRFIEELRADGLTFVTEDDVRVTRQGDTLTAEALDSLREQAGVNPTDAEIRERVAAQNDLAPGDVAVTRSNGSVDVGLTEAARERQLRDQVLSSNPDLSVADVSVDDFDGDGDLDVRLSEAARQRRARESVAADIEGVDASQVDLEATDEGFVATLTEDGQRARADALVDAAPEGARRAAEQEFDIASDEFRVALDVADEFDGVSADDLDVSVDTRLSKAPSGELQGSRAFGVELDEDAAQRLRRQDQRSEERFGDDGGRVLGIGGGEEFLDGLSSGFENDIVEPVADAAGVLSRYSPAGILEQELTGGDTVERSAESFTRGVGDVANLPQVVRALDEGGELIGYVGSETVQGRGGEAVGDIGEASLAVGGALKSEFDENPFETISRFGGAAVASAGTIGVASRLSGTAGRAASFAIQPGEEIATTALGRAGLPTSLREAAGAARGFDTPNVRGRASGVRDSLMGDFEVSIAREIDAGPLEVDPAVKQALADRVGSVGSGVRDRFSYSNGAERGLGPATETPPSSEYVFYNSAKSRGLDPSEFEGGQLGPRYSSAKERGLDPSEFEATEYQSVFKYTDAQERGVTGGQTFGMGTRASIEANLAARSARRSIEDGFTTARQSVGNARTRLGEVPDEAAGLYNRGVLEADVAGLRSRRAISDTARGITQRAGNLRETVSNPTEYTVRIGPRRPNRVPERTFDIESMEVDGFSDTERAFLRFAEEESPDGPSGRSGQLQTGNNVNRGGDQQTVTAFQTRSDPVDLDLEADGRRASDLDVDADASRRSLFRRFEAGFGLDEPRALGTGFESTTESTPATGQTFDAGLGTAFDSDLANSFDMDTDLNEDLGFDAPTELRQPPTFDVGTALDQSQRFDVERDIRQRLRTRSDSKRRSKREGFAPPSPENSLEDAWFTDATASDELFSTGIKSGEDVLKGFEEF